MRLQKPLVLASASPRRRRLLEQLGLEFDVLPPAVDEIARDIAPEGAARENAARKHAWCARHRPDALIIAADTVINLDGILIGKPRSRVEAVDFLKRFSGREHCVITAVALTGAGAEPTLSLATSRVSFRPLTATEIQDYLSVVDPLDKAGAYDIADHGALIVAGYDGSWTNIMGLPVETLQPWIERWQAPA